MAVPAHTRNDFRAHLYFQGAGLSNPMSWVGNPFEWYVKQNPWLVTMSNATPIDITNASITRFWDTNRYNGSICLNDNNVGLAEYTNANFFSESTIFAENKNPQDVYYFPHPARGETNAYLIEQQAEDGITDKVYYVVIKGENYRLAAYSYFYSEVDLLPDPGWAYNLDDAVYYDYAQKLLPRAIGYSAGLINYFFRGQLDIEKEEDSKIKIVNKSSENMEGAFELYYDDTQNNRYLITSWNLSIPAGGKSSPLSFTPPSSPEPMEKGKYILVFKGRHGEEEGSVTGKAVSFASIYIFAIQETAELYGQELTGKYSYFNYNPYYSSETSHLYKSPYIQRAKGYFYAPRTTSPGGLIKRIRLSNIDSTLIVTLLINGVSSGHMWEKSNNSIIPETWEVTINPQSGQMPFSVLWAIPPRYLIIETSDGKTFQTPLLWWRENFSVGSSIIKQMESCIGGYGFYIEPSSTTRRARFFLGDGNQYGYDESYPWDSPHTNVSFKPVGSVGGYEVGTVIRMHVPYTLEYCVSQSFQHTDILVFSWEPYGFGDKKDIDKNEVLIVGPNKVTIAVIKSKDDLPKASAPSPRELLTGITSKRDFLPKDLEVFQSLGIKPPEYTINLK